MMRYLRKLLHADGVHVSGSVFLRGSRSMGELRLINAMIGSNLECDAAEFVSTNKDVVDALNVQGAIVRGDIFLREDSKEKRSFISDGDIELVGAQIGGDLDCTGGKIKGVLDARRAIIKGAFIWMKMVDPSASTLNLRDASTYALRDDSESWPAEGHLWPEGFLYVTQVDESSHHRSRLDWLARMKPFAPSPYRQLAKVLRDSGDEDGSIEALVEMERMQRSEHLLERPGSAILRFNIGYGYHPLWAAWELLGLAGLGWIIYRRGYLAGAITPKEKSAYEHYRDPESNPPCHYTRFSPLVYSIENSLPLVNLGQTDCWGPDPNSQILSAQKSQRAPLETLWHLIKSPSDLRCFLAKTTTSPIFLQRFLWVQIILGWVFATLFAAGITGIIRKD